MDFNFCTVSSKSRLYQCMALYDSLNRILDDVRFFVLCMDEETYGIINALKGDGLIPVNLNQIETAPLLELKGKRSESEYCWTMKPVFIESIMENYEDALRVTYVDADMFFFNSPKPIYTSGFGKSIWLTPHNYNEPIKDVEKEVGKYNSGFISFKKNKHGLDCLKWWKNKCIEWCYNTTVGGRFGDQKYLDDFKDMFDGVMEVSIPGVNIAPWNDMNALFETNNGKVYCNGNKLICYHFCGFKVISKNEFMVQFGNCSNDIIHKPYMKAIKSMIKQIERIKPGFDGYYHKGPKEKNNVFSI